MKVKIYTMSTCSHCIAAKKFLKENNIEFENIELDDNQKAQEEMIEKSGQMAVPVIDIDIDGKIINGFDEGKLKQVLGIKD